MGYISLRVCCFVASDVGYFSCIEPHMTMPVFIKNTFNQHLFLTIFQEATGNIDNNIPQPETFFALYFIFIGVNRSMFKT